MVEIKKELCYNSCKINWIYIVDGESIMITKTEYLLNPCGTLSIPYWKYQTIAIPSNIKIIHRRHFNNQFNKFQRFFRLLHKL